MVRCILRSPLRGLIGGKVLVLTVTGRKSEKRYRVPLNYVRDRDALICFTGKSRGVWWRNVGEGTPVSVRLRGRDLPGTASLTRDPNVVGPALAAFLSAFPSNAKQFRVALDEGKQPDQEDIARAAREDNTVMIRLTKNEPAADDDKRGHPS